MPTELNTSLDPLDGNLRRGEPQENQFKSIAGLDEFPNPWCKGPASQRRFKGEIRASFGELLYARDEHRTCFDCYGLWREAGKALSDDIGVDERIDIE